MTADRRPGTGRDPGRRRRIGLAVGLVPVFLFALSVVFIVVRRPAEERAACTHDHATEQVREWWEAAREEESAVPGTRYVAFDDSLGCIHVGLDEPRARSHLERRFRSLDIPSEVVIWEMAGAGGTGRPGDGEDGGP